MTVIISLSHTQGKYATYTVKSYYKETRKETSHGLTFIGGEWTLVLFYSVRRSGSHGLYLQARCATRRLRGAAPSSRRKASSCWCRSRPRGNDRPAAVPRSCSPGLAAIRSRCLLYVYCMYICGGAVAVRRRLGVLYIISFRTIHLLPFALTNSKLFAVFCYCRRT